MSNPTTHITANDDDLNLVKIEFTGNGEAGVELIDESTYLFAIDYSNYNIYVKQHESIEDFRLDPLCILIKHVVTANRSKRDVIFNNSGLILKILNLLGYGYPEEMVQSPQKKTRMQVNFDIDMICLRRLLNSWPGWKQHNFRTVIRKEAYDDMYCYLRDGLNEIQCLKDSAALKELSSIRLFHEDAIILECSLRQLKFMFHQEPRNFYSIYRFDSLPFYYYEIPPQVITNWPFVSTQIRLPYFSMIHENVNYAEYHVFNYKERAKGKNIRQDIRLQCLPAENTDEFQSSFILAFLKQFKDMVNIAGDVSSFRKTELTNVITDFEKDVAMCTGIIETEKLYHAKLNRYGYVRYMSRPPRPIDLNTFKQIEVQKSLSKTDLNVRLSEVCFPRLIFRLGKFQMPYTEINNVLTFIFDKETLKTFNNCLTYHCKLCDGNNDFFGYNELTQHLCQFHGAELDWECLCCKRSYSTKFLAHQRWFHKCYETVETKDLN